MTVLVTGANGMLAPNIIERPLSCGYDVIATIRKGRTYQGEKNDRLTVVDADFKDRAAMFPIISRCDAIIHVAAMTSQSCRDYSLFKKVNADASVALVEMAVEASLKRFVYVSSSNTIGYGAGEDAPMKYPFSEAFYALSKKEGEDAVMAFSDKIDVVVVNPTFMVGKYGSDKGSNRVLSMVRRNPVVFCPSGGKNLIDVGEAARGIVMAMEKGRNAGKYLICGKNYTYAEMFSAIARRIGVKDKKKIYLPDWLLTFAGKFGDLLCKCGIITEVNSVNMDMLLTPNYFNTDKAYRDFGFKAAPFEEIAD